MLRMAHRVLSDKSVSVFGAGLIDSKTHSEIRGCAAGPCFCAYNIAEYVNGRFRNGERISYDSEIAAAAPPPFMRMSLEYGFDDVRYLACVFSIDHQLIREPTVDALRERAERQFNLTDVRWSCAIRVVADMRGRLFVARTTKWVFLLSSGCYAGHADDDLQSTDDPRSHAILDNAVTVTFFAFRFANCRNVITEDVTETEGPPAKWLRRMKQPRITYKVLKLDGTTRAKAADSESSDSKADRALHICRGHFKHYTAEKPLFGHYVGTVWHPQHVRGHEKNGVVVKDYKLEPVGQLEAHA